MAIELSPKSLRRLVFALGEVQQVLRSTGRQDHAQTLAAHVARLATMDGEEFVNESRSILENALLGERDLPGELIGAILDAMDNVDNLLREATKTS